MPVGGRSSFISALLALALGAAVAPPATAVAPTAYGSTAAPEVQIIDLPTRDRARPRAARTVGVTDDFGVVMWREADPNGRDLGVRERVLADGTSLSGLDRHVDAVFGNRLVSPDGWDDRAVSSRVLPASEWSTLPVPEGQRLVGYTADGVLLGRLDTSTPEQLEILPWDGSAPTPVTLSEAHRAGTVIARGEHAVVTRVYTGSTPNSTILYVDTAAQEAWPIELSGACANNLDRPWGLHDDALAWHGTTAAGEHVICTMPAPDPADPASPAISTRPAPTMPGVEHQYAHVGLLPLGDLVVVSRIDPDPYVDRWDADDEAPVYAVDPDGSTTTLTGWGHDVVAGPDGQVVLVGGASPADQAVRQVAADGSSTVLAVTTPVAASYSSIAVDDQRVAFVDDSAVGRGLVENELADGAWTSPAGSVVDEGVGTSLAAGEGAVAWTSGGGDVPTQWAMRDASGQIRTGAAAALLNPFLSVSDRWILHQHSSYDQLIDTVADRLTIVDAYSYDTDLVDGVLYLPSKAVPNGPEEVVIARDLATGEADTIEVPNCGRSSDVQAAGSWLLVSCETGARFYDRTETVAPFQVASGGRLLLGNGFLVRRAADGTLSWRDLALGEAGPWQSLGDLPAESDLQSLSVSRGAVPTVAWFDRRTASMTTLPVSTSPVAAKPTGVTAPSAPAVTAEPRDRSVILRWPAPDPAEQVTGYWVRRVGSGVASKLLPASATKHTFYDLTNGKPETFEVTALNIAGRTVEQVTSTPVAPPAHATNIDVAVDRLTSKVTVTWDWDWQPSPHSEELQGFTIWAGQPVVEGLDPDARQATFVLPDAGAGRIGVEAEGVHQSSWAESAEVTWPGLDTTAPRSSVGGVRKVLLGNTMTISLRARDDRKLAPSPMDLRWRSAAQGERLGPWRRPASWQGVAKGSRTVKRLAAGATYCFSTRARDHAGNVSRWSPARCTAVAKDDRALSVRTSSWQDLSGRRWFRSTARRTSTAGAVLGVGRVRADDGWIVATTCPSCGRVQVRLGRAVVGTVNLRSAVRRDRRVIRLPWARRTGGRVTLRAVDSGKPVIVDGIAFRSY